VKRDEPRWLLGQGSVQGFFDFAESLDAARLAAVTLTLIGFFSFIMVRITSPQMVPLFTELSVEDSALIVEHLEHQAMQYELENDGAIMMLSKDDVARLRIKFAESDVPKSGGIGYEWPDGGVIRDQAATMAATRGGRPRRDGAHRQRMT